MLSQRPKASRLQADLARRLVQALKDQKAQPGYRLVELELCRLFKVSRTPVRGALCLLREDGIAARRGRSHVLVRLPGPGTQETNADDGQEARLFKSLAQARVAGQMPDPFSQQDVVRRFGVRLGSVVQLLRHLAELGLVERKPGNGWAFIPDPARILSESYAFRRALEPQMLLQPGFRLDRGWAEKARSQHQKLRKKVWRMGDGVCFHALNADFHEQLARSSGNRAMLRAVQWHNELRQFLIGQWEYPLEQMHSAIDEHLEILAALQAGYADKAAALMLHHLTQSASQSQKDEAAEFQ